MYRSVLGARNWDKHQILFSTEQRRTAGSTDGDEGAEVAESSSVNALTRPVGAGESTATAASWPSTVADLPGVVSARISVAPRTREGRPPWGRCRASPRARARRLRRSRVPAPAVATRQRARRGCGCSRGDYAAGQSRPSAHAQRSSSSACVAGSVCDHRCTTAKALVGPSIACSSGATGTPSPMNA